MIKLRGRNGDPQQRVQQVIDDALNDIPAPRVLEAGCGSMTRIVLPACCTIAGIDISARQLDRNTTLNEKIQGDLQQYQWGPPGFDLIVCWDVIEHLEDPRSALQNLAAALNPGGTMVLAFPHFWSLKGLVTKFTPFKVHAWFYYLLGDKRRIEELDQFPTPFSFAISPHKLQMLTQKLELNVVFDEIYEGPVQAYMRRTSKLADLCFAALAVVSNILTLGTLDLGLSDCILILRRPLSGARVGIGSAIGFEGMSSGHIEGGTPTIQGAEQGSLKAGSFNQCDRIEWSMRRNVVPTEQKHSTVTQA
jgi:SAM-dependent methyltransferase